jgi:regulator of sirC expression with transglutaminase-like and TPR domain
VSDATRARLAEIVEDADPDLAEANLLIAAEGSPGLDMEAALGHVEGLARIARETGVVPALRDQGFRGDADDYDDPRNSFLDHVLERRRGLPIALATLALGVARRVGAPLVGVGLPGHFVIADRGGPEPVVIDPFGGWRSLDLAECARVVERTAGMPFRLEFLDPVGPRAILARTLLNLRGSYLRRRRPADALWTVELGLVVAPGDPGLIRESITLLAALGRYEEAEAAAAAFLSMRPPGDPAAAAVEEQVRAIHDLQRRMN